MAAGQCSAWPRRFVIASHDAQLSGAQRALLDTCAALQAASCEVVALLPTGSSGSPLQMRLADQGTAVREAPVGRWTVGKGDRANRRWLLGAVRRLGEAREVLREIAPDVVLSNTGVACSTALAARREGIPHAWLLHESQRQRNGNRHVIPLRGIRWVMRKTGPVFVPSEWLASEVEAWNGPGRTRVVESAVRDQARPLHGGAQVSRLVFAGGHAPIKRLEDVIRAVGALAREGTSLPLDVYGGEHSDARTTELEALVRQQGVEQLVRFRGVVENLHDHLDPSCVLVSTSEQETFGRVLVEAMRQGSLVVAIGAGASVEVVENGRTGLLVPAGSPDCLATSIAGLVADPRRTDRMRDTALEVASSRWTLDRHAASLRRAVAKSFDRET